MLAVALGNLRYPFTSAKWRLFKGVDVNVRDGGAQIEYKDQDPRIHRIYLDELEKSGVRVTRIARGIPSGGEIVHMNAAVLGDALRGRSDFA